MGKKNRAEDTVDSFVIGKFVTLKGDRIDVKSNPLNDAGVKTRLDWRDYDPMPISETRVRKIREASDTLEIDSHLVLPILVMPCTDEDEVLFDKKFDDEDWLSELRVYCIDGRHRVVAKGSDGEWPCTMLSRELLSSANAKMYNVIVTGVYNSLPVQPPTLGRILLRFFRLGTNRVESMSMSFDFIGTRREVRDRAAVLANCPITREVLGNRLTYDVFQTDLKPIVIDNLVKNHSSDLYLLFLMGMKHLEMFERSRYTSDLDRLIYNSKVTLRELSSVGAVQALSKRLLIPIYTLLNEIKLNKKKKKMKGARGKSTAQVIKSSKLEAIAGMDPSEESLDNMRRALKEMKFQEGSTLYSAPFQQVVTYYGLFVSTKGELPLFIESQKKMLHAPLFDSLERSIRVPVVPKSTKSILSQFVRAKSERRCLETSLELFVGWSFVLDLITLQPEITASYLLHYNSITIGPALKASLVEIIHKNLPLRALVRRYFNSDDFKNDSLWYEIVASEAEEQHDESGAILENLFENPDDSGFISYRNRVFNKFNSLNVGNKDIVKAWAKSNERDGSNEPGANGRDVDGDEDEDDAVKTNGKRKRIPSSGRHSSPEDDDGEEEDEESAALSTRKARKKVKTTIVPVDDEDSDEVQPTRATQATQAKAKQPKKKANGVEVKDKGKGKEKEKQGGKRRGEEEDEEEGEREEQRQEPQHGRGKTRVADEEEEGGEEPESRDRLSVSGRFAPELEAAEGGIVILITVPRSVIGNMTVADVTEAVTELIKKRNDAPYAGPSV